MECKNQQSRQSRPQKYECLLFDVDDTLYPLTSGLSKQCTKNIEEYMVQQLGIEKDGVAEMNQFLYRNYGTSMAGLKAIGYEFDNDHYHSFVHGRLPYHNLKRDPVLRSLLLSLPIRKVIFSNADDVHVAKVLNRLGLEGCFDRVICFETLNSSDDGSESDSKSSTGDVDVDNDTPPPLPATPILCKPSPNAFESALKIANIDPKRTLFFDDSIRNIKTGKSIGLHTVLVGSSNRGNGVDYALESIHNIREALPELWEVDEKMKNRRLSGKIALETSIVMA
ncbi:suppressor of disruption of TFIIS-like [Cucurbita moschata]|uniref:Suppressor of disruption of TFIIS-like n=1 Tax=Cucurbita moschata TaxID=3662 RepID=A0A6J1HIG0_CUCMO|nr:suppressor of disruption of TFIIS-like [Cucurbita moschata]